MEYDFTQIINSVQLLDEIAIAGLVAPSIINTAGSAVSIIYASPLSDTDSSTLSTVVANHVANINYVPLALQAQITTLTGYLNSTNPATQSIARAAILAAMGPRLPLSMLTAINASISAKVGS